MRVQFSDITPEGLGVDISGSSWHPHDFSHKGEISAKLFLRRQTEQRVSLKGELRLTVLLTCDRCLEEFEFPLAEHFVLDFELLPDNGGDAPSAEHSCSAEEMDTIYLSRPEIDLFFVLEQQLALSVPMKKVCSESCRGICSRCGAKLAAGRDECDCRAKHSSPFAVLADLKITN